MVLTFGPLRKTFRFFRATGFPSYFGDGQFIYYKKRTILFVANILEYSMIISLESTYQVC
jgi:hypothetical protein